MCINPPYISHLLFADDCLILMRENSHNANTLKRVLDTYCGSSGQLVSSTKSGVIFSPNTSVVLGNVAWKTKKFYAHARSIYGYA